MSAQVLTESGETVALVFYSDTNPQAFQGLWRPDAPNRVWTDNAGCRSMEPGSNALLVRHDGSRSYKAEVIVEKCEPSASGWLVFLGVVAWEELDRRRHPRYNVEISAQFRAVRELDGEPTLTRFEAVTSNLSLCGAGFTSSVPMPSGSLVNVTLKLGDLESARMLGIVVWSDSGDTQFGVEFLDFIGDARYRMHRFLSELDLR
jgi:hypothetical protein